MTIDVVIVATILAVTCLTLWLRVNPVIMGTGIGAGYICSTLLPINASRVANGALPPLNGVWVRLLLFVVPVSLTLIIGRRTIARRTQILSSVPVLLGSIVLMAISASIMGGSYYRQWKQSTIGSYIQVNLFYVIVGYCLTQVLMILRMNKKHIEESKHS